MHRISSKELFFFSVITAIIVCFNFTDGIVGLLGQSITMVMAEESLPFVKK